MGKPRKSHPSLPLRKSSRPKRPSLRFPSSEWHLEEDKLKNVNNLEKKIKVMKNKMSNSKKTEKLQMGNVDKNMIMNQEKKVSNDTEASLEDPSLKSPHTDHMNVISLTTCQGFPSNSDENHTTQSHIKEEPRHECEEEIQIIKEVKVYPKFQTLAQNVATVKQEIQVKPHESPSTDSDLFQPRLQSNQRNLTGPDVDASVDSPVPSHLCNERGDGAGLEEAVPSQMMSEVAAASSGGVRGVGGCHNCGQSDSVKIKMEIEISTRQFIEIGKELPGFLAAANVNKQQ